MKKANKAMKIDFNKSICSDNSSNRSVYSRNSDDGSENDFKNSKMEVELDKKKQIKPQIAKTFKVELQSVQILRENFEQRPVGKSTINQMSQYPENYVPTEMVVEQIQPLIKRIHSKVWKVRQEAYLEIIQAFGSGDLMEEYQQHLNDFITDSNISAQEKGFKILEIFVSKNKKITIDKIPIYKSVIEKGLTSTRSQIVKSAQNILVELYDKGAQDQKTTIFSITEGMSNKNVKIASCCIDAIIPLLTNYGLTRLEYLKPFLKQIQKLNENNNAGIKTSICNFYKEAYKWLGELVMPSLNKFKKSIIDEVKSFISAYTIVPMIPLRAHQSPEMQNVSALSVKMDPYSFTEPVNVIDKFDERWCNQTLQLRKWSEKKDAVDIAVKAFSVSKIMNRDYLHLISFINRLIADSNYNIIVSGLRLLKNLANGLRRSFAHGAKLIYKEILFKLRDKKQMIVQEVHKVLHAFLLCMTFEDMIEKVKQNLLDKAPNMKVETLVFVKNSIKSRKQTKCIKTIIDILRVLLNDATVDVREKSFETLCKIKSIFGIGMMANIDSWKNVPKDKILKIKNQPELQANDEECLNDDFPSALTKTGQKKTNKSIDMKGTDISRQRQNNKFMLNQSLLIQKQSHIYETPKSKNKNLSIYFNINSPDQSLRYQTYNNLLFNPNQVDYILLRQKARVESSQTILRLIASLVERSFSNKDISKEALQFLLVHDWRNHHNILQNVFRCLIVKQRHRYIIEANHELNQIFLKSSQFMKEEMTSNTLVRKLYQYSLQFRFDDRRQGALRQAIDLLGFYRRAGQIPEENSHLISEITVNMKHLFSDKNQLVVENSIHLAGDLVRAYIITKVKGKAIIPLVLKKIDDPCFERAINIFLEKCLETQSSFLLHQLILALPSSKNKKIILQFILTNINVFAVTNIQQEFKSIVVGVMACLKQSPQVADLAEAIIDKIIAQNQDSGLIKSILGIDKSDIPAKYLKKYKLDSTLMNARLASKFCRIQALQNSDVWPLSGLVPSAVQRLIADLEKLPVPCNSLSSALPLCQASLEKVFVFQWFEKYSDLFVQWMFWRFHVERLNGVLTLLGISKRILRYPLKEIELFIVISGALGALELERQEIIHGICSWADVIYQQGRQRDAFGFYVKALETHENRAQQILSIIVSSYSDLIAQFLPLLSTNPRVRRSEKFIQHLRVNFNSQFLKAHGFIIEKQSKDFISKKSQFSTMKSFLDHIFKVLIIRGMQSVISDIKQAVEFHKNDARYQIQIMIAMMQQIEEHVAKGQSHQNFNMFAKYFRQTFSRHTLTVQDLRRLYYCVATTMCHYNSQQYPGKQAAVSCLNSFIMLMIAVSSYRDSCLCIFEVLRNQLLIGQEKRMVLLIYAKFLSKLKTNVIFNSGTQQGYTIMLECVIKLVQEFTHKFDEENFVQKRVKLSLLEYFELALPHSVNITTEKLASYKNIPQVVKFFDFLFKSVKLNNPIALESDSLQATRKLGNLMCNVADTTETSNVLKKENPFLRFSKQLNKPKQEDCQTNPFDL